MGNKFEIKDSGDRRDFDSGATRDVDHDKPRFDLIPVTVLQRMITYYPDFKTGDDFNGLDDDLKARILSLGFKWGIEPDERFLLDIAWISIRAIQKQEEDGSLRVAGHLYSGFHLITPKTYVRLANHYGGGAKKYNPWNWSKGMPLSVFHASLMRHIFDIIADKTDEDHLSAIFFNVAAILHFQIIKKEDVDDVTPRLAEWFQTKSRQHELGC